VWLVVRAELRLRWRAIVTLALLIGLIGGVALTAAAGARRTQTAYPRLLRWAHASQYTLISGISDPPFYAALRRLPQVESVAAIGYFNAVLPGDGHKPGSPAEATATLDSAAGASADRVKILAGRAFNPAKSGLAMVDEELAKTEHLRPGGVLRLVVIPQDKAGNPELGRTVTVSFTVTAIVVFDNQVVPNTRANAEPAALLSAPFSRTGLARSANYGYAAGVRLAPGASWQAFLASAGRIARAF
jgi:hypothetical protein